MSIFVELWSRAAPPKLMPMANDSARIRRKGRHINALVQSTGINSGAKQA
jgi:hypothetical protein